MQHITMIYYITVAPRPPLPPPTHPIQDFFTKFKLQGPSIFRYNAGCPRWLFFLFQVTFLFIFMVYICHLISHYSVFYIGVCSNILTCSQQIMVNQEIKLLLNRFKLQYIIVSLIGQNLDRGVQLVPSHGNILGYPINSEFIYIYVYTCTSTHVRAHMYM